MRSGLLLLSLISLAASRPASAQPADLTPGTLMASLAAAGERRGTFHEEKLLGALAEPLLSWGRLTYRRPAYLAKTTTGPTPEQLVVDGGRLVLTLGQDAPRVIDLDSAPELQALVDSVRGTLAGDLPMLRRSFTVAVSGQPASWRMVLKPTDARVGKVVSEVVVDGAGPDPLRIATTQPNGDTDRLDITPDP